ncbi:phage tail protein [Providencia rettgeri]|uniref:phage tail-collar fiber domain-containing protein n=1 Tax=Providencia rettgeri TaxID=587 RepID=UPI002360AAA0|nr:phage tail protein [Providencia rettgeri]
MEHFFTILTNYGKSVLAEALATQKKLEINYMAVGDGGGTYYEPIEDQTNLRNELWRGALNDLRTDDEGQGQIVAEAIIPMDIEGDWIVREIGLLDKKGGLVALGKYPEIYIPPASSGVKTQIYIRIVIQVGNIAAIQLTVDNSQVLADKSFVNKKGYGVVGSFSSGLFEIESLTNPHQLLDYEDEFGVQTYRWIGEYPKEVHAGSTPESTGGIKTVDNPDGLWVSVGDASARRFVIERYEPAKYIKLQSVSFDTGATLENAEQVLRYSDGFYYQYTGKSPFPLQVTGHSVPDGDWRCVGDASYPLTVDAFGGDSTGQRDSSTAAQLMFDNFKGLSFKTNGKYVFDKPVRIYGSYPVIQGNKATIYKNTTTKSGLSLIQTYLGYAIGDVNCFFIGSARVSYPAIDDLILDARQAPLNDRPVGFYFPQITNYGIEGINTLGCKHSLWVKSSWVGNLKNFRGNESTSDDFFYDSSRVDKNGNSIGNVQSATSVTMDGVYSNTPGGIGFRLERVDYSNLLMTACDHPKSYPYYIDNCKGLSGSIAAESFTSSMILGKSSTLNLTVTTYADGSAINKPVFDLDNVSGSIKGNLRLTHTILADAKNRTNCNIEVEYYNGKDSRIPLVFSDSTSIVTVSELVKTSEFEYDKREHKYGRDFVKGTAPFLGDSLPPKQGAYSQSVFKSGNGGSSSLFLIPLTYIQSVLPSFNTSNGSVFSVTVDSETGYSYGATFRNRNGNLIVDLESQRTVIDLNTKIQAITLRDIYLSICTIGEINNSIVSIKEV